MIPLPDLLLNLLYLAIGYVVFRAYLHYTGDPMPGRGKGYPRAKRPKRKPQRSKIK